MQHHQLPQSTERDDLLPVLANETCRNTLAKLRAIPDGVASVDELAGDDRNRALGDPSATAVHLHHVTLPRLADAGLVYYDSTVRTVRYQRQEGVEARLDELRTEGDR